ncbi:MAG: hybrid sensor histidine kinase/response regulator [Kaiparowitsia implicata GSE-PSE-MK54-09C]|jgi:signal transduction histidine kinase|nr:hybrid sensor histidine kinase/response regulator [Kaiparowitsia implicata GSE-PSE-MK54-09C]
MEEQFKILVVDDDEVDRMAVRRALKTAQLTVNLTEAWDFASAIAALETQQFDCIFIDYRLPDKDGLALVQDLRGQNIRIPLIVLTGQGDEQVAVDMMKAGASDYLSKSRISPQSLARVLQNSMRVYRAEQEAKLAKQQREQLIRQREDFVSRLTHDLRTPLVAADRMYKLFQEDAFGELSPEMQDAIAVMVRSNKNLLQMVNTLLEVYRHESGRKSMSFSLCDMRSIVQEVAQELTPLIQEKGLQLIVDLPEDGACLTSVLGDSLELRRVLINLVGNSIKFTDEGSISIRLRGADPPNTPNRVRLDVIDTGGGIPSEDLQMLFERFRQGNHKRAGSGLGLYLSRRIIETHRGNISVKSELGKGSIFTVRLPARSVTRPPAMPAAPNETVSQESRESSRADGVS